MKNIHHNDKSIILIKIIHHVFINKVSYFIIDNQKYASQWYIILTLT